MTDHYEKKQHDRKSGLNPVVAVVTGAVVGAGVAVALKDKKNRAKVMNMVDTIKDQAVGYMKDMQDRLHETTESAEEKLTKVEAIVKK